MAAAKKTRPTKAIRNPGTVSPEIKNPFAQEQRVALNSIPRREGEIGGKVKTHKTPKDPELGGIRPIPTQKYLDKLRKRSLEQQQLLEAPKKKGQAKA